MAANTSNKKKKKTGIWIWVIVFAIIIIAIIMASVFASGKATVFNLDDLKQLVMTTPDKVQSIYIEENGVQIVVKGTFVDGNGIVHAFTSNALSAMGVDKNYQGEGDLYNAIAGLHDAFGGYKGISGNTGAAIASAVVPMIITIIFYIVLFWLMFKMMGGAAGGQGNIFGMSKNKAKLTKSDVTFKDVAGIKEEKAEVEELVDYLKTPDKYKAVGARAPKGILLEGPPGTGKTLLAKAVAGEAGVNFFSISGSEFDEMFVGLGASRIRDLFDDAKKNAPCIIFIDEIDAVGRKRTSSMGGGTNDQTLNQLLVELDGFETNSGVIVMAATNRSDVLDPALLRPGRFDRIIKVGLPDIKEREAILKLHAKNKKVDSTIDWYRIAQRTPGFSGAQLANVLNEAAILTIRENHPEINIQDIDEAIDRVVAGPAKTTKVMTQKDKEIVSYHESGHALIGLKLESASKVQKVTIIPRGDAGGYTIMTPKDETIFQNRSDLVASITGYMGGRAAEAIMYGEDNVTTGAHDDLDKATRIARNMIVRLGMSDTLGMARWLSDEDISYGRSTGSYSDVTAAKIDNEVEKILDEAYANAKKIIKANMPELKLLAESLRILETITAEQIEYIDKYHDLPEEVKKEKVKYDQEEKKIKDGDIIDIDVDDAEKSAENAEVKEAKDMADENKKSSTKKSTTKKPSTKKSTSTTKKTTKKSDKDETDSKDKK